MLLIGNNRYDVDLFTLGKRERLDEGILQLWAAPGWLPTTWEEQVGASFRIEVPGARVRAAVAPHPHVRLVEGYLSPADARALVATADCFVSLQSRTGFGEVWRGS